jgi:hypothetical protein
MDAIVEKGLKPKTLGIPKVQAIRSNSNGIMTGLASILNILAGIEAHVLKGCKTDKVDGCRGSPTVEIAFPDRDSVVGDNGLDDMVEWVR